MRHGALLRPERCPSTAASDHRKAQGGRTPQNSALRVNRKGISSKRKVFKVEVLGPSHKEMELSIVKKSGRKNQKASIKGIFVSKPLF